MTSKLEQEVNQQSIQPEIESLHGSTKVRTNDGNEASFSQAIVVCAYRGCKGTSDVMRVTSWSFSSLWLLLSPAAVPPCCEADSMTSSMTTPGCGPASPSTTAGRAPGAPGSPLLMRYERRRESWARCKRQRKDSRLEGYAVLSPSSPSSARRTRPAASPWRRPSSAFARRSRRACRPLGKG